MSVQEPPHFLAGVQCFRCDMKHVVYEIEDLEDGVKLGFYHCTDCRTQWYDTGDIMPYLMRLKLQLRGQWVKPAVQPPPTNEPIPNRATRPP